MAAGKKLSLEELAKFDGKDGRLAYVAFKGNVYDVTDSPWWFEGNHLGEHDAGKDLTEAMGGASHGSTVMDRMKLVGTLT